MYVVDTGNETETFEKRMEAVRAAKKASNHTFDTVKVLRKDGWERMLFRRGSVQEKRFITPERRRKVGPLS